MKEQFLLNKRERNGLFLLLGLIFIAQLTSILFNRLKSSAPPIIEVEVIQESEEDLSESDNKDQRDEVTHHKPDGSNAIPGNNVQHKSVKWKAEPKRSNPIPNSRLNDFIPEQTVVKLELNGADSVALMRIYGIGPVLSKRIIKYRDLIGGFVDINQLQDVYGIDAERFEQIRGQLFVDNGSFKKTNVFTASIEDLATHFFISWKSAKIIKAYSYEVTHDTIQESELISLDGLDPERIKKALPYLDLVRP